MYRSGYIWFSILIIITVGSYFFIKHNYSQIPNAKSQEVARSLEPYPNATSWKVTNDEGICIEQIDKCKEVPSKIIFSTTNSWGQVYRSYLDSVRAQEWKSNTRVLTSIPSTVVFSNNKLYPNSICEMIIKPNTQNLLGLLETGDTDEIKITIACYTN